MIYKYYLLYQKALLTICINRVQLSVPATPIWLKAYRFF